VIALLLHLDLIGARLVGDLEIANSPGPAA